MLVPFAFAIDQQDRIWVTNILGHHVTRFSGSDPTKSETFETVIPAAVWPSTARATCGLPTSSAIRSVAA